MERDQWRVHYWKKVFQKVPQWSIHNTAETFEVLRFNNDPLGIIALLTIRVRKILQEARTQGPKWDALLDDQQFLDILNFRNEPPSNQNASILRAPLRRNTKIQSKALHKLTEASEYALSAVSHLKIEYFNKTVDVVFMMGKARVAPIKRIIIPDLELQAIVYGAQLPLFIKEQQDLEMGNYFLWSDSTTELHWLRTPELRQWTFVAKTMAKILDVSQLALHQSIWWSSW